MFYLQTEPLLVGAVSCHEGTQLFCTGELVIRVSVVFSRSLSQIILKNPLVFIPSARSLAASISEETIPPIHS